jgi:hypothetical protein
VPLADMRGEKGAFVPLAFSGSASGKQG